ncbi:unnamed protein product [Calypogeia fissa]
MATVVERTLELNVISATHLKKVKTLGHQTSYVVAYIYPDQRHTSQVDYNGGLSPAWNFKLNLKCNERLLQRHGSYLTIEIYSKVHSSDKLVGTVIVPLRDLAKDPRCNIETPAFMSFEVCRPSGLAKGVLNLSVRLGAVEKRPVQGPADHHSPRDFPPFVCTRVDQESCTAMMCAR